MKIKKKLNNNSEKNNFNIIDNIIEYKEYKEYKYIIKNDKINIIIFSKNRACQLDFLLKSIKNFFINFHEEKISVLYTYTDNNFKEGYKILIKDHNDINFIFEENFKNNLLSLVNINIGYTVFLVDDNVFINTFDKNNNENFHTFKNDFDILCYSLRLGDNIIYNYIFNEKECIPEKLQDDSFYWPELNGYWGYPMSLDGHIFRTKDIINFLENMDYKNPNELEFYLSINRIYQKNRMICNNGNSIIFNNPLNIVQDTEKNKHSLIYNEEFLNKAYKRNIKISKNNYENFLPESAHQEVDIQFTTDISILMPLYNGIEFIDQSVGSIINQTHKDWELIIGINGHGNNSKIYNYIKNKYNDYNKIKVIDFATKGKCNTLNEMIKYCNYNWISLLDVDDYWVNTKLSMQIKHAIEYDIIGTRSKRFGKNMDNKLEDPFLYYGKIHKNSFKKFNSIINSSVLLNKNDCYWNDEFEGVEDYELWCRLNSLGKNFYNINEALVFHRIHSGSSFNTKDFSNKIEEIKNKYNII